MTKRKSEWLTKAEIEYGLTHGVTGHFFVLGGMPEPEPRKPLPKLSAEDEAKLYVHLSNMKKYIPEMVSFANELIREGMMPKRNIRVRAHKHE